MAKKAEKGDQSSARYVATIGELAEIFGVARTTVSKDWRASGIVPRGRGPYDLREVIQNKIKHELARAAKSGDLSDSQKLQNAKLANQVAKLEQETQKIERQNLLSQGELLLKDDVERYLTEWSQRFRTPLIQLGDKVASRVPGRMKATVKAEVQDVVRAALRMVLDLRLTESKVSELIVKEAKAIARRK